MDYVSALISASRYGSLRDLEQESGWTDKRSNSSMSSVTWDEFVGFKLEEATQPKAEILDRGGERGPVRVDRQFRRDERFRIMWNSDDWNDTVQALAVGREGWAELCSRTTHIGEDADNHVRR
ncbi:hypothetical protein RB195_024002 [Necator americanus]|uniref:Uncharacterized protein n=1 Tax=Necator americanus TaxID=51031 RepID=A0ABR1ELF7_NECAM